MWPVFAADSSPVGIIVQVTESTPSHQQAAAMNQALIIGSVRQHELTEQAEEALHESVQRFRFVAESMPQKIFTAKPNGDVDYLNQQWIEFTGLAFDQLRNWGWTQFIHPDDIEETSAYGSTRWKRANHSNSFTGSVGRQRLSMAP